MRDLERWKDQVELSLDGRQIFFLFFGSAVAACVIFVAGVLVGKRIEQRACVPAATADPLAVLDQLDSDEGLTFHRALAQRESRGRRGETLRPRHVDTAPASAAPASAAPASAAPEGAGERATGGDADEPKAGTAHKPEASVVGAKRPEPVPAGGKKPEAVATVPRKPEAVSEGAKKPEAVATAKKPEAAAGAKKPEAVAAAKKPTEEHYTLQISAFSEKSEAEEFLRKIQAAGYRPFLMQTDIPGRGTFYRVRVGDYTSKKAALDAKTDFEHRQRLPVYVAKL